MCLHASAPLEQVSRSERVVEAKAHARTAVQDVLVAFAFARDLRPNRALARGSTCAWTSDLTRLPGASTPLTLIGLAGLCGKGLKRFMRLSRAS